MSYIKRHIENEIEKIASESGYKWDFLMEVYNEMLADGNPDLENLREVAIERDYCQFSHCGSCEGCPANGISCIGTKGIRRYKLGDVISFTLTTGEPVEAMAVKETAEGMIFCFVDCLEQERQMNAEWTNKGGFGASDLRKVLNTEVLNTFPEELKERMKPFPNGDMLRIPTEKEIFGVNEYGEKEEEKVQQWEPMKLRRNRIALEGLNGPWQWYWLQNASVTSAAYFAYCSGNGRATTGSASSSFGVRPAFLIGNL